MIARRVKQPLPFNLEHVALFLGAVIVSSLSALYALWREESPPIPFRVQLTAGIGGFLAGVMAFAVQVHVYGFSHPWLAIALAVPAGFGSPLVIAAGSRLLMAVFETVAKVLGSIDRK